MAALFSSRSGTIFCF